MTLLRALAAAMLAAPLLAFGQAYPSKPIKLVAPYPPGASTDNIARLIGQKMSESMGVNVIVENRAGASGNIGSEYVSKQPPDGYTILLGTDATHATNMHLMNKPPYDMVKDFTPITIVANNYVVLVVPSSFPADDVKGFIDYVKKNPGKMSFGSSGTGSPHHLAGELMKQETGIDMVHVPYKGGAPAMQDILGGQIPSVFASLATASGHIRSGKLKALGVTQDVSFPTFPNIPPIGDTLKGFEMNSWFAFFGPAGLPAPVLQRLNAEIVKALKLPDVRAKLEPVGLAIVANTPEQALAVVKADSEKRAKLLQAAGIPKI